uniref:Uncharacterized protein n=1 Tax=Acrobeloides nanus TaxID=290746 RepID=A0A914DIT2_9BILA
MRKFDEPVNNNLTFDDSGDEKPESRDEKEVEDTEDDPVDEGKTQYPRIPSDPIKKLTQGVPVDEQ